MEGRWRGLMDNVENRPWIEYVAILDSRTRPGHRALNGKVFRYDDRSGARIGQGYRQPQAGCHDPKRMSAGVMTGCKAGSLIRG